MRSLFLRIFLWFCAATSALIVVIVISTMFAAPDLFFTGWRRVGRGTVVSAAKVAADVYERTGASGLDRYLKELNADTGLQGEFLDAEGHRLAGVDASDLSTRAALRLSAEPESQLILLSQGGLGAVRMRGSSGALYSFFAILPPRDQGVIWSRSLIAAFFLAGCLMCYLLARYLSAPVLNLRAFASRFASADFTTRVTDQSLLHRKDEIGGLARDFDEMAARIDTLMRAQKRLLADVSHELRSPLTRLGLALGLLRRDAGDPVPVAISRLEREVERLNALIQQILTLSRLECAADSPAMERLDLAEMLAEVVDDANFEATCSNRSVRMEGSGTPVVLGVRELLRSAVENVIRNAVRYSPPETAVLVRLVCPRGAGEAVISVEDNGPGVPENELTHIFEPFHRVDETRQSGGAGLGLAITQQVMNLHNGSVQAANRESGGLEIRMSLPLAV